MLVLAMFDGLQLQDRLDYPAIRILLVSLAGILSLGFTFFIWSALPLSVVF